MSIRVPREFHFVFPLAIKGGEILFGFALATLLARILPIEDFGNYAILISAAVISTNFSLIGSDSLVVRELVKYKVCEQFREIRGLLTLSAISTSVAALLVSLFFLLLQPLFLKESVSPYAVLAAAGLIPVSVLISLLSSVFRAEKFPFSHAYLAVQPFTILLLSVGWYFGLGRPVTLSVLFAFTLVASILPLLGYWLVLRKSRLFSKLRQPAVFEVKGWVKSALPFLFISSLAAANREIATILLGSLATSEDAALFRIANRAASLTILGLWALNMSAGPTYAELYRRNEIAELQRTSRRGTLLVLVVSMPAFIVLIAFGPWLIELLFGEQ